MAMGTGKPFNSKGPALEIEPRGGVVVVIDRLLRIRHVLALVGAILLFHGIAPGQSSILRRVPGSTDEISVSPASSSVSASQTLQFTATGRLRGVGAWSMAIAAETAKIDVVWSLSPNVGTISAAGLYTAPAAVAATQTVTVNATSVADPTKSATATVTLTPPVSISLTPLSAALAVAQTQQFTATVGGTSNSAVTWTLSPAVGTISAAGLYTAPATIAAAQTVTVKATSVADPTKYASATVTLSPTVSISLTPPSATLAALQSQQFTAMVGGASNSAVTWTLSPAVGTISAAGLYTAPATIAAAQTVTVKATSVADPTKYASATVTLSPPVTISLTPLAATLTASQTQQLTATVGGASNAAVTWSLSPVVGIISAAGLYTAPATITTPQTVTVKASSVADPTKYASATVALTPPVSISLTPLSAALAAAQAQHFTATVGGTSNSAVTWTLSPAVGTISAAGLYTAPATIAAAQTVTVKASSVADPTKFATATVTLSPPVTISLAPLSATLAAAQAQQFTATVGGTSNSAVTWTLSSAVGTISAAGLYTAPATITTPQTVTVMATSVADPTKSASATVALNPPVPVNVTVNPASVTLKQSQTQSFTATVTNTGNTAVTWSISPVVGSVTAAGLYTAPASIGSGQNVTVKATSTADPTKSASATVSLDPPVTVSVTPSTSSLTASKTQQFTATVTGTANTGVMWSLNPAVGTISTGGNVAVYTAPSVITAAQNVEVSAISMADSTKLSKSVVTLIPAILILLTPTSVNLQEGQRQEFTAAVSGTTNQTVDWSLSPATGTLSTTGLYTAPATLLTAQTVTVTAQSAADPTKSASSVVSLQSGPVVWVVGSLYRVGTADAAGTGTTAKLWAGRGEYESFQIITRAPTGNGLTNVNVTVSDLISAGGQTIAKSNVSLFREQYVFVSPSSRNLGGSNQPLGAGWYPDGLIPFVDPSTGVPATGGTIKAVPFSVSVGKNQPIWVDVFVPRTAASGQYFGTYTVTSDQGSLAGQITLIVWNFTLPLQPSLKSAFDFWTDHSLQAQEELLRNKLAPTLVTPGNQPILINNFGLGLTDLGYFSGANYGNCTMDPAPSISQLQANVAIQQPGLYLYNVTADEIDACTNLFPTVQQWAYNLHQAGIENLIAMKPVPQLYDDGSGSGRSAVDIWELLPDMYDAAVSNVRHVLAKGDKVWSYNALVQDTYSPKWQIDFAPINFRIQPGFISQSLGLSGLVYWRVDYWSSDPWNEVNNTGQFSSNNYPGEGMLVYPGSAVGIQGVAPSMRLKWLRDGVEDYEYVELLKKQGYGAWALQVAANVGPDWTNWTRDPVALELARTELGQQLDAIFSATTTPASYPAAAALALGAAVTAVLGR